MPYNTTAIPPRREPAGSTQLPLSRIKKMIALDQDIATCASSASFLITIATEMFIQYMAEQGHNVVKSERKPRRNIQYRDLSNAVARLDNLEFLVDVVPRTVPYKQVREKKTPTAAVGGTSHGHPTVNSENSNVEAGQMTLDVTLPIMNGSANGFPSHGGAGSADRESSVADPNMQLEMENRVARRSTSQDAEMS
ncbi:Uncharacterized protein BP5553_04278 [Venustampulla echinocandica]|uniref:Transcription factor CBF/NF-Y/archaeal histone domain-containing protein n=1 Tax=Venustampulla echinocandica TaxID=2656787 RepID=A0A370TWT6_9HELO|nr:Uncharacterized protein BP5553_04278 [Venustampulla echinocandica]RDL39938.1 Uncharacterized protein BP5553_04278 [Venustampulla echinocandica]